MNIWQELHRFAESRAPAAVETTLLGRVPYAVVDGRYESEIPWQLRDEANRNGLRIVSADYRRNVYVIELLPDTRVRTQEIER
jgi:hypothetical protein